MAEELLFFFFKFPNSDVITEENSDPNFFLLILNYFCQRIDVYGGGGGGWTQTCSSGFSFFFGVQFHQGNDPLKQWGDGITQPNLTVHYTA